MSKGGKRQGLNDRQKRFVAEYAIDSNATQAAIRAGYSKKTAYSQGERLLRHAEVAKAIADKQEDVFARLGITHEKIIREYGRLAFADAGSVMEWGPDGVTLLPSKDLSEDVRAAVAEASESETKDGGSIRLKMHDKKGALDSLARIRGMFIEKHELGGPNGGPIPIQGRKVDELSNAELLAIAAQGAKAAEDKE